jgi:hypothetical protein
MPEKSLGEAIDEIVQALSALPEGARATAIRAACDHLGLTLPSIAAPPRLGAEPLTFVDPSPGAGVVGVGQPTDIRTLKEQKQPGNNQEMACVMAYYLQSLAPQGERKTVVSAADISKYFAQAGFPLPKAPAQVLVDAKGAGYFDAVDRGTYKLNPVGYNLVVHSLPRQQGAARGSAKPRGAKRAARVTKRKTRGK